LLTVLTCLAFSSPAFLVSHFPVLHFHVLLFCASFSSSPFSTSCNYLCTEFSCRAFSVQMCKHNSHSIQYLTNATTVQPFRFSFLTLTLKNYVPLIAVAFLCITDACHVVPVPVPAKFSVASSEIFLQGINRSRTSLTGRNLVA